MTSHCPHVNIIGDYSQEQILKKTICDTCQVSGSHLWACLHYDCLYVGCDEFHSNHLTNHYRANNEHCLALNLSTFRLFCLECECDVFITNNYPIFNKRMRQTNAALPSGDRDSDEENFDDDRNLKPKGLTGLQNIGNTCYMNAAIQALSNCPPMTDFFLDCGAFIKGEKKPGLAKSYCKLMSEIWHKRRPSYVNPSTIAYGIKLVFPVFRGYNQQDSQEFLRCFMDQLHEEMKEPITVERVVKVDNSVAMDIDLTPDGPDSTDESSVSEAEYETCESGVSSEKGSCSEKVNLTMDKNTEIVTTTTTKNGYNHRGGMGGSRQRSSQSETVHSYELSDYDLPQTENSLCNNVEVDRSDASSEQSAVGGSTALLLSRPSSSLSSIHDKVIPSSGHLLKGLSISSPQLKLNHTSNVTYPRYQSQPQVVSRTFTTKVGKRKKQIKYRSIISDVFDGKILSSVQCLTCDRVSSTKETFQDLSLPIPSREYLNVLHASQSNFQKANSLSTCTDVYSNQGWLSWMFGWMKSWFWGPTVSLQDCLAAFFSADELKGDNMYSCEKCKKLRNGIKYSKVLSLPEILCIHLKRFRHEVMFSSKISNYVSFPLEDLEMQPFLHKDCSSKVSTYDLVAVICHHGTAIGGHYITYALNCINDQWYEYDDQCVTEVDPQTVAKCQAYVLFYRKNSEEMTKKRQRAMELMEISRHEPSLMQFYISKQWVNTFNTFAEPSSINNSDFLCVHEGVHPNKYASVVELCTVLSQGVWEYLHDSFGGGPPCTQLYVCSICQNELQALEARRRQELEEFLNLRRDPTQDSSNANTCAISMSWFRTWESFVKGKEDDPPGAIDNSVIATTKSGQTILRMGSDYAPVSVDVWLFLHNIYGGGPYLPLRQTSIGYGTGVTPTSSAANSPDSHQPNISNHVQPTTTCNVHSVNTQLSGDGEVKRWDTESESKDVGHTTESSASSG